VREAGPRADVRSEIEPLRASVEQVWRAAVAAKRRDEEAPFDVVAAGGESPSGPRWSLLIAAALLLTLGVASWLRWGRPEPTPADVVALVDRAGGEVWVDGSALLEPAPPLLAGASVRTGEQGRVALALTLGHSVRLAERSELRVGTAGRLVLERGRLYVDSRGESTAVEVATPFGSVRELGTQFSVAVPEASGEDLATPHLEVAVRRGAVALEHEGAQLRVNAGERAEVRASGTTVLQMSAADPAWDWTLAIAPAFELEGSSLSEFLVWLGAETGWEIHFVAAELEDVARSTVLHGDLGALDPRRTPGNVFPLTDLDYVLEESLEENGGVRRLIVRRR
jgi:hypothetical protein